jgi:hypothetical protein
VAQKLPPLEIVLPPPLTSQLHTMHPIPCIPSILYIQPRHFSADPRTFSPKKIPKGGEGGPITRKRPFFKNTCVGLRIWGPGAMGKPLKQSHVRVKILEMAKNRGALRVFEIKTRFSTPSRHPVNMGLKPFESSPHGTHSTQLGASQ